MYNISDVEMISGGLSCSVAERREYERMPIWGNPLLLNSQISAISSHSRRFQGDCAVSASSVRDGESPEEVMVIPPCIITQVPHNPQFSNNSLPLSGANLMIY